MLRVGLAYRSWGEETHQPRNPRHVSIGNRTMLPSAVFSNEFCEIVVFAVAIVSLREGTASLSKQWPLVWRRPKVPDASKKVAKWPSRRVHREMGHCHSNSTWAACGQALSGQLRPLPRDCLAWPRHRLNVATLTWPVPGSAATIAVVPTENHEEKPEKNASSGETFTVLQSTALFI